jgi:hypothetical protein
MRRGSAVPDYAREKRAIEELAEQMVDQPGENGSFSLP